MERSAEINQCDPFIEVAKRNPNIYIAFVLKHNAPEVRPEIS